MTPFTLYRPFEFIRNYVDYEKIPVKLIGAGRDKDYLWLGWSHWATDDKEHLSGFKNIVKLWPEDPEEMEKVFDQVIYDPQPYYVNLSR
jgi:transketolase